MGVQFMINPANPLVRQIDADAWAWASEAFRASLEPVHHRAELLASAGRTAAWMLRAIRSTHERSDPWEWLFDTDPALLQALWALVTASDPGESGHVLYIRGGSAFGTILRLHSFSDGGHQEDRLSYSDSQLPRPSQEWLIEVEGTPSLS
jgi:hypothetical protein